MKGDIMKHGWLRVAVAAPRSTVADIAANLSAIRQQMDEANDQLVDLLLFPALCVTGAHLGDLFLQETLQARAREALGELLAHSKGHRPLCVVSLPLAVAGSLYQVAAVLGDGKLLGLVPKETLSPAEKRQFTEGIFTKETEISIFGETIAFGTDLLFTAREDARLSFGVSFSDPHTMAPATAQLQTASVLCKLSAEPATVGSTAITRAMLCADSYREIAVHALAAAGCGESSTDFTCAGACFIAECGDLLAASAQFVQNGSMTICDVDLARVTRLRQEKTKQGDLSNLRRVWITAPPAIIRPLRRRIPQVPFLPPGDKPTHYEEILNIQSAALIKRLEASGVKTAVIGISGGLDSTLALLVTVRAFDQMGRSRQDIIGVTMPGFGTTGKTHAAAKTLMQALGINMREISIRESVLQHFKDIEHDPDTHDVTYENAQARERTQILMDLANQTNGLVIGTGNLSELALGFATYGGDHLSMYAINAGLPKTVLRDVVSHLATTQTFGAALSETLQEILNTPISPELLPNAGQDESPQKTEELIGPYVLHDFFLYHILKHGFTPGKIAIMAECAFAEIYDRATILRWMRVFYSRFFSQQFKRSCLPDGPQIGAISLSPRGGWHMPSDAVAQIWMDEIETLS